MRDANYLVDVKISILHSVRKFDRNESISCPADVSHVESQRAARKQFELNGSLGGCIAACINMRAPTLVPDSVAERRAQN